VVIVSGAPTAGFYLGHRDQGGSGQQTSDGGLKKKTNQRQKQELSKE
jgi:hypothetical protein